MAKVGHDELPADLRIESVVKTYASNLYGALAVRGPGQIDALYLRRKENGTWLVIIKRMLPGTIEKQVIFAQAGSWAAAIIEGSKAVARGSWKADKPWGSDR